VCRAIQAEISKPATRLPASMPLLVRVAHIAREDVCLFFAPFRGAGAAIKDEVARQRSKRPVD
jgi:hypothetical protein